MENKFTDQDGNFLPSIPHKDGEGYTIGYLEELLEWIYLSNERDPQDRLSDILQIEKIISDGLKSSKVSRFTINYIPTWSVKLKEQIDQLLEEINGE